jgi:hypothetical protein
MKRRQNPHACHVLSDLHSRFVCRKSTAERVEEVETKYGYNKPQTPRSFTDASDSCMRASSAKTRTSTSYTDKVHSFIKCIKEMQTSQSIQELGAR